MKFFAWAIAILSVNQIIWQTPNLPQMVYYAIFLLIAIVMVFYHPNIKINVCMLFFIMAIVCSIFVNYIPDYFMPWDRFFSFLMVILCVSPFLYNSGLTIFRKEIFDKVNILFVIIVIVSFLGYLAGVYSTADFSGFRGCTSQSMLLSPIAALTSLFCLHKAFCPEISKKEKYLFLGMMAIAFLMCLLAGSRASLAGGIVGILYYLKVRYRRNMKLFLKVLFSMLIVISVSYPLWESYLVTVAGKIERSREVGSMTTTRDALWQVRMMEFKESPVCGIGFNYVDETILPPVYKIAAKNGVIEPGSGWLFLLSSLGIMGTIPFLLLFGKPLFRIYKKAESYSDEILIGACLSFFAVHLIAEGYITSSGSFLFFYLWLLISLAQIPVRKQFFIKKTANREQKQRTCSIDFAEMSH